jgi:hypothetical protein
VNSATAAQAFLGGARDAKERACASALPVPAFDPEIYRLLSRFVTSGKLRVIAIDGDAGFAR